MSSYLGFDPTENPEFYFVSYNNEDADRVGPITSMMAQSGIPLWYDYGIEYGEQWTNQINRKLSEAKTMILFFTRGILEKRDSYVQKEFKIARFFRKKVIIVMLDEIQDSEVPVSKVDWWVEINEKQILNLYRETEPEAVFGEVRRALGYPDEEKLYDVYISYKVVDVSMAEKICAGLEADGLRCCYAARDIPGEGSRLIEGMFEAVEKSRMMVTVLTEESKESKTLASEFDIAQVNKIPVLPFVLMNGRMPRLWQYHLQRMKYYQPVGLSLEDSITELKKIVRMMLGNC